MDIVKHGEPAYPVSAYGGDSRNMADLAKGHALSYHGVPILMPKLEMVKKNTPVFNVNKAFHGDENSNA